MPGHEGGKEVSVMSCGSLPRNMRCQLHCYGQLDFLHFTTFINEEDYSALIDHPPEHEHWRGWQKAPSATGATAQWQVLSASSLLHYYKFFSLRWSPIVGHDQDESGKLTVDAAFLHKVTWLALVLWNQLEGST